MLHHRILAIDPGTHKMGVALLKGEKLLYHGVKVFARRASPKENLCEGRKFVLQILEDFRPSILAIEKTFVSRNRRIALLNVLADEILHIARRRGLQTMGFAPGTVKKYVCGDGHAGKEPVAVAVARQFPELSVYLSQNRKWKARHHANMFDAVAVGLTAQSQL